MPVTDWDNPVANLLWTHKLAELTFIGPPLDADFDLRSNQTIKVSLIYGSTRLMRNH